MAKCLDRPHPCVLTQSNLEKRRFSQSDVDSGLWIVDFGLRVVDGAWWVVDCGL